IESARAWLVSRREAYPEVRQSCQIPSVLAHPPAPVLLMAGPTLLQRPEAPCQGLAPAAPSPRSRERTAVRTRAHNPSPAPCWRVTRGRTWIVCIGALARAPTRPTPPAG